MTEGQPPWRPPGPGRGQPGRGPLANQVAFELGQGGEHVEDQPTSGGGGVDGLLEAAESDAAVGQPGDRINQVAERAAQSIELPDH
jgi:hypothetical protein